MWFRFGKMYFCPTLRVKRRKRKNGFSVLYSAIVLAAIALCCLPHWCLYVIATGLSIFFILMCFGKNR